MIEGIHGGPAYLRTVNSQLVYYAGDNDSLKAFELRDGHLSQSPASLSSDRFPRSGSIPSISSNGTMSNTAIVWTLDRNIQPLSINLYAYDATNLTNRLGKWSAGVWNNNMGMAYITPTIISGKVYVATSGVLKVFGLR